MIYEHRIIVDWPGELRSFSERKGSPFQADWAKTMTHLEYELGRLEASDVVLETAHSRDDVRMDGSVKTNATPMHPGVILSFDSMHGPLRYFTDAYNAWRANVRAIGLGLEALRAVDRYGISGRGEQYTGFARLMAAIGRPDLALDPAYASNASRCARREALDAAIAAWTRTLPAKQAEALLEAADVPCSRLYDIADCASDPHFRARGAVLEVADPLIGRTLHPGPAIRLDGEAPEDVVAWPGPAAGAHTDYVLRELLGLVEHPHRRDQA